MDHITMNKAERKQLIVLNLLKYGEITQVEAALKLNLSARWVREKLKRYLSQGDKGIVHKGRGRASPRQWIESEKTLSIDLLRSEWQGFGPTFAAEKLEELHGIKIDKETLRKEMVKAGVWRAKNRRLKHRKRRERRTMLGMMVQLDGSPHDWFEGRAPACTLLVFIDDATSRILWLEFVKSESRLAVIKATKNYIQAYGAPHCFYVDYGSVFSVNTNNPERDKITQFERIMAEMNIEVKHAGSPQAKGRVERSNRTMQDRLIKEMRLAGISSLDEANRFLRESNFITKHNQRFAVLPARSGDAHRIVEEQELEALFVLKEKRVLANDFTITYKKRIFQLSKHQSTIIRPKEEIIVNTSLNGTITLTIRKVDLMFQEIKQRPQKRNHEKVLTQRTPQKPSLNSRVWASGRWLPERLIGEERVG